MSTTYELRQLLAELVSAWPDGYEHPSIDVARRYLETDYHGTGEEGDAQAAEDLNTEMWYST